jgi:hypothetical protein
MGTAMVTIVSIGLTSWGHRWLIKAPGMGVAPPPGAAYLVNAR